MNEYAWLGDITTGLICQMSASDAVVVGEESPVRRPETWALCPGQAPNLLCDLGQVPFSL